MTRFRGTLVRPLAEQADRDGRLIDPDGVAFEPGRDYPLFIDFDMDAEPSGWAVLERGPGGITAEGEITGAGFEDVKGLRLAVGVAFRTEDVLPGLNGRVIATCRLNGVSLTPNHADPGQPPIEEVP